jgi:hypothetical protein
MDAIVNRSTAAPDAAAPGLLPVPYEGYVCYLRNTARPPPPLNTASQI